MPTPDSPSLPVLPVSAVNLPFLGSRLTPHSVFQYLLHNVDATGATFSVPAWVVRREHFRVGDRVDFHFPFRTSDGWNRHHGEINEVRWDAENNEQVCHALLRDREPLHHPVFAALDAGAITFRNERDEPADPGELLRSVLRDCHLLKRGVGVYFKHLVPLFSRITLFPTKDYGELRSMVLEDIRKRIDANIAAFAHWDAQAAAGSLTPATLSRDIDLENLRTAAEGEIDNELLETTFDTPVIRPYTSAIRLLEQKLYLNYNTLVLLFAHAL